MPRRPVRPTAEDIRRLRSAEDALRSAIRDIDSRSAPDSLSLLQARVYDAREVWLKAVADHALALARNPEDPHLAERARVSEAHREHVKARKILADFTTIR